ncbi:MAG: pyridoxal-phosphate dependent enzyme, partial [Thermoproteota archaeon]
SFDSGKLQSGIGDRTIADGISVKNPGKTTFKIINELIDDIVLVDDTQIIKTMFLLLERAKMVVEPAGAVSLAYLLKAKPSPRKKVVPILAGGNVDMYLLGQIVAKGLTNMGRMIKIFILLPDKPGALKEVVDEIATLNANIVEVVHDRLSSKVPAGSAGVTLSLETEDQSHADKLIEHLKKKNIQFEIML